MNLEKQRVQAWLSEGLLAATAAAHQREENAKHGHDQERAGEHHEHANEAGVGEVFAAAEQVEPGRRRGGGDEHKHHEAEEAELEAWAARGRVRLLVGDGSVWARMLHAERDGY